MTPKLLRSIHRSNALQWPGGGGGFLLGLVILTLLRGVVSAQENSGLTDIFRTADGRLRLTTGAVATAPDSIFLQSADSPAGPWVKETEAQRNAIAGGYEFLTPRKPYHPRRYYRLGTLARDDTPFLRFIAPKSNLRRGQPMTLLGANFAPAAAGNTVTFERPDGSWTAPVTAAASNYLVITVPADLPPGAGNGNKNHFGISVTTAAGISNAVGCDVFTFSGGPVSFQVRPSEAFLFMSPGTGKETLVVGGGVPPYFLQPLSAQDMTEATVTFNGPVLEVTGLPGPPFRNIDVKVTDSSNPPQEATGRVFLNNATFAPTFSAGPDTLQAGTAPGMTMSVTLSAELNAERIEFLPQNLLVETGRLRKGMIIALANTGGTRFSRLTVREVTPGRAVFDVVSLESGVASPLARGALIENPPAVVIDALDQEAATLTRSTVKHEFAFMHGIFRLPAAPGQNFSMRANLTSVSAHEERYAPVTATATQSFTTTDAGAGNPKITQIDKPEGEAGLNVSLGCTGVSDNAASNTVTFAGAGGTRVPANIVVQTVSGGAGNIIVAVPNAAITGPVRVTTAGMDSNDYAFRPRFRPVTSLIFDTFPADTPVAPRITHTSPRNDGETSGEIPIKTAAFTLERGSLNVAGLTADQEVGTARSTSHFGGSVQTFPIFYEGQEPAPSSRHKFKAGTFSTTFVRFYFSPNANGSGVTFQWEEGFRGVFFSTNWEYQFTHPVYRTPAGAGTVVTGLIDTGSQPWLALPDSEMHVLRAFSRTTN